jgi:hypothetical protein
MGAPSIRTVLISGTNIKQREAPKITGSNTKANNFQKGSKGFKATTDMNPKKQNKKKKPLAKIKAIIKKREKKSIYI